MADHDQLIVMFRKDKDLAARQLARGIAELCFAPILGVASLPMLFLFNSVAVMLVVALASLICLGAGIAHLVGGISGLRDASRELAQIEALHRLPEARLIER